MSPDLVFQAFNDGEGLDIATDFVMTLTLISTRIQAFLYLSPFFNKRSMLRVVRVGFMLSLTVILFPGTFAVVQQTEDFHVIFLGLVVKEFIIGTILGVVMWMPIRGLELTGTILDMQRGSMQAMGMDPVFGGQTTPTAVFLLQMFSGYFFATGALQIIQMTLFRSGEIWPFTEVLPPFNQDAVFILVELAGILVFTAIAIAVPISALMLLADIVIAFIAKTAPTLNALTFGMPVKSFILCIMLFFYLEIAYPKLIIELERTLQIVRGLFV